MCCGIVGLAGQLNDHDANTFAKSLFLDQLRGKDSTGIAIVERKGDIHNTNVYKTLGTPDMFSSQFSRKSFHSRFREGDFLSIPKIKNCSILLGHNRWATVGNITEELAHPYDFSELIGVHNGTLRGAHKLKDGEGTTDSFVLFETINDMIVEDGEVDFDKLGRFLYRVIGALSIVFYCKRDNCLYFYRNHERPMFIARGSHEKKVLNKNTNEMSSSQIYYSKGALAFASDKAFLEAAFNSYYRNQGDKTKWGEELYIESTKVDTLYKFKISYTEDKINRTEGTSVEIVGEENFFHSFRTTPTIIKPAGSSEVKDQDKNKKEDEDKKNRSNLVSNLYRSYAGLPMDRYVFESFVDEVGCAICGEAPKWEDREGIEWWYFDCYCCATCESLNVKKQG